MFDVVQVHRVAKRETIKSIAARHKISESYLYRLRREGGVDIRNEEELRAALSGRQATPDAQRLLKARAGERGRGD